MKNHISIFVVLLFACCAKMFAQQGELLEYKMDIGGGTGLCYYWGDANNTPFKGSSVMAELTLRRNFNPRMSLKTNLAYGNFSGSSKGWYLPEGEGSTARRADIGFRSNVLDLGVQFELNFWGYGIGPKYKKLSRITPYMVFGVGATLGWNSSGTCFGANFPLGGGVKYKVRPRLNLILEWTHRFTTTDRLDDSHLSDPYYIKSSGVKNKDSYSFFCFSVTYDISPKYRKCNN